MFSRDYYAYLLMAAGLLAACQSNKEPVVATVGSAKITLQDVQTRLSQTPAAYQQYASTPEGRRQFLDILIREKILVNEARRAGLQNEDAFRQSVDHFKKDQERQLEDYKGSLLVESYLKRLQVRDLAVSDADVARFYADHQNEFAHPVELQVSHILLNSQAEADDIEKRLKNGESFDTLARQYSKDPTTASQGGHLAPFRAGTLPPDFEKAAFALHTGEISPVVKTQFGFHIIKKTGERPLPPESLEQAKETIRKRLEREKFNEWIAARQSTIGVHVDERLMSRLGSPSQEP